MDFANQPSAIATELSIRASNAAVAISFRLLDGSPALGRLTNLW